MHQIHSPGVNGDVSRADPSDVSSRSLQADEIHIDNAELLEGSGDRQAGGEGTAEAVDKHVDLLALVLGKLLVNGDTDEVITSDVAFELNIIGRFRHGIINFATKLDLYHI